MHIYLLVPVSSRLHGLNGYVLVPIVPSFIMYQPEPVVLLSSGDPTEKWNNQSIYNWSGYPV